MVEFLMQLGTFIFYAMGIPYILYEIYYIGNIKNLTEEIKAYALKPKEEKDKLMKEQKGKKFDEMDPGYKKLGQRGIIAYTCITWWFVGLFSTNWLVFGSIIVLNIVVFALPKKYTKYNLAYRIISASESAIFILLIFFAILNRYHLHINLLELLKKYL